MSWPDLQLNSQRVPNDGEAALPESNKPYNKETCSTLSRNDCSTGLVPSMLENLAHNCSEFFSKACCVSGRLCLQRNTLSRTTGNVVLAYLQIEH